MRKVRFNFWHMLLVTMLVLGMIAAILSGIHALLPQLRFPGLLALLALTTVDAVITQRLVVRERLSIGEQGTIRAVEWLLLSVAIRVASLSAEGIGLVQVLQPWLRDPMAFFGGQFFAYFWPTLITWGVATMMAQSVLDFEIELPREGVRSLPSEEAAVLDDRAQALANFDRSWLGCMLVALAGAGLALYQIPLVTALQSWTTVQPVLAVLSCLIAGLALHSQGQLDRLRYGWQIEQLTVAADVPRRWRRASGLVIVIACVLGLLLSQGTLWIPPPPLIPIVNALLVVITFIVTVIVAIFGLLLFPFAWLLSWLSGTTTPTPPIMRPIPPPQLPVQPPERPLLPALIFWTCMVILIGVAALRYVQQRQDLRAWLLQWPGVSWLLRIFGVAWHDLRSWSSLAVQTIQRRFRRSPRRSARVVPPAGAQAQLRLLYRRMVHSAERQGVYHARSQTPYEFHAALGQALPPVDVDAGALTDVYVTAEYGPRPAQPGDVRRARKHWRRIKQSLARSQRTREPLSLRRKRGP